MRYLSPGQYEYSNLAAGLLGHTLARAARMSYEELVRERVLDPLGMEMSGITLDEEMQAWLTAGHDNEGNVVPLWDIPTLAGAGALRSNAQDMLIFLAANVGEPETDLERAMRDSHEIRKEVRPGTSVGLNWHIRTVDGRSTTWHNGGTGGFRTFAGFDAEQGVGVVVLTNSGHGADDIGFHLLNPAVPLAEAPEERLEVEVAEEILAEYVGKYQLAPTFSIAVTLEDGSLFVQATSQPRFPIFAESESKFFLKVVDAQVSFVRDDAGEVTSLILHQGGMNQPAEKVD